MAASVPLADAAAIRAHGTPTHNNSIAGPRCTTYQAEVAAEQQKPFGLRQVRANALPKVVLRPPGRLHHQVLAFPNLSAVVEKGQGKDLADGDGGEAQREAQRRWPSLRHGEAAAPAQEALRCCAREVWKWVRGEGEGEGQNVLMGLKVGEKNEGDDIREARGEEEAVSLYKQPKRMREGMREGIRERLGER